MSLNLLRNELNKDTPALTHVINYWRDFNPNVVIIAYTELKRRDYSIGDKLESKINKLCETYNIPDIDKLINEKLLNFKDMSDEQFIQEVKELDNDELFIKTNYVEKGNNLTSDRIIFTIIGAILGLPASYYFQPGIVRSQSLVRYLEDFDYYLKQEDLLTNIIVSILVFIILGLIFAYFKNKK